MGDDEIACDDEGTYDHMLMCSFQPAASLNANNNLPYLDAINSTRGKA